ncbi:MAG: SIS domain-containing protein [Acidobacteria bacterium]|jgi:D-sedoheptulose 7-phosphate isomerase|nr:SIS domain-containing protein [Acidobacteriota bacterium]
MNDSTSQDFSRSFYPFLHQESAEPQVSMEELRFSLMEKAREGVEVKTKFFEENTDQILKLSHQLAHSFHRGGKLLVCGNGGSSTDAQHIAVEFMHPITVGRKALPAICLTNDMAMVTAVANDVGFGDIFTRQIIALGKEGDSLIGLSTSGNSENLMHAFATARKMNLTTIGFAGGNGGNMAEAHSKGELDFCLTVPTSSIHRIQESHVALYHILWDMVHSFLQNRGLMESEEEINRDEGDGQG